MSSPPVTSEDLRALAETVWAAQDPPRERTLSAGETLIGEMPSGVGQVLTLSRRARGDRQPIYRFRHWKIGPDGSRTPLTYGMNIAGYGLPTLAGLFAAALQYETDLLARGGGNYHPATRATLRQRLGLPQEESERLRDAARTHDESEDAE